MTDMFGEDNVMQATPEGQEFLADQASSLFGELETVENEISDMLPDSSSLLEDTGAFGEQTDANPFLDSPPEQGQSLLDPQAFTPPEPTPEAPSHMTQNPGWMDPSSPLFQEPQQEFDRSPRDIDPDGVDKSIFVPPTLDHGLTDDDDRSAKAQDPPSGDQSADPASPTGFDLPSQDTDEVSELSDLF